MKIKKLYLYIFKTFIPLFFYQFCGSAFSLVMQTVWFLVGDLVGKGVNILSLVDVLHIDDCGALALVLAMLLASLMTYGNLGEPLEAFSDEDGRYLRRYSSRSSSLFC